MMIRTLKEIASSIYTSQEEFFNISMYLLKSMINYLLKSIISRMVFFANFEGYFPTLRVISVGCPFTVVYCPSPWFTRVLLHVSMDHMVYHNQQHHPFSPRIDGGFHAHGSGNASIATTLKFVNNNLRSQQVWSFQHLIWVIHGFVGYARNSSSLFTADWCVFF